MATFLLILVALCLLDVFGGGVLLAFVWAEHRRLRRLAVETGQPVPRPAYGDFLFLVGLGLLTLTVLLVLGSLLLDG
jgi:hypothetical protein